MRHKQSRPTRPKRANADVEVEEEQEVNRQASKRPRTPPTLEADNVEWRSLLLPELRSEDCKEVAEINVLVATPTNEFPDLQQIYKEDHLKHGILRVRLQFPSRGIFKVGGIQVISKEDLRVQVLLCRKVGTGVGFCEEHSSTYCSSSEIKEGTDCVAVIISGELDGHGSALSALVYLIRQEYISLLPAPCLTCSSSSCWGHELPVRLRVLIRNKAFTSCHGLNRRFSWMKELQTLIFWLRPELVSPTRSKDMQLVSEYDEVTKNLEQVTERNGTSKELTFDPSGLYEAVKPSRNEPSLDMDFPQLLPDLRPYQRRAAYWMVQRERGLGSQTGSHSSTCDNDRCTSKHENTAYSDEHPLWLAVPPVDGSSPFFFNPYIGAVSMEPPGFLSYVKGGILADEMGLGKTVELLACIIANRNKDILAPSAAEAARELLHCQIRARKRERVECACGAVNDNDEYKESWIQCDVCDAWQHATCVGHGTLAELSEWQSKRIKAKGQINKLNTGRKQMSRNIRSESFHGAGRVYVGLKRRKTMKRLSVQNLNENKCVEEDLFGEGKFVCGACSALIGSVEVNGDSGATLIVCPTPILQQWQDEILRHTRTGSLQVILYEGVEKGAVRLTHSKEAAEVKKRLKLVSAHDLAAADIVLTSYDTLRADLCHDPDKTRSNKRSLRFIKRYPVIPTPLTRLCWWRVCLDEAQMVEGNTTRATEMALLLDAQNRWCVTGTPIQRGLDDLFGLLRFLQAEPFDDYFNWNQALRQPYEAGDPWVMRYMHKFLGSFMWRSSKSQVKDELNLPPQEECLSWLRFSAVEAHFYRQQHEKCAARAREMTAKHCRQLQQGSGTSDSSAFLGSHSVTTADQNRSLSRSETSLLFTALLKLRQACCHPQVGSAGVRSLQQRSPMTMDEILQTLVCKAKIEAEEAQRALIGALNGLAALAIIDIDIPLAISIYREALTFIEENAVNIDVDPLQKLHTLHNLLELLEMSSTPSYKDGGSCDNGTEAKRGSILDTGKFSGMSKGASKIFVDPDAASSVSSILPGSGTDCGRGMEGQPAALDKLGELPRCSEFASASIGGKNLRTRLSSYGENSHRQADAGVSLFSSEVPWTSRDEVLAKQCKEIRSKYMGSFRAKLESGLAEFENAHLQVSEAKKDCEASGGPNWWLEELAISEIDPEEGEYLVSKIRFHLLETDMFGKRGRHRNASSLALRFQEIAGLKYVVQTELDALETARDQVLQRLKKLNEAMKNPTVQDAEKSVNCSRHSGTVDGSLCAHCEMDDLFQMYENRLFLLRTSAAEADAVVSAEDAIIAQHRILAHKRTSGSRDLQVNTGRPQSMHVEDDFLLRDKRGAATAGATEAEVLHVPSETEQILSLIRAHARQAARVYMAATKHLHMFDVMKKEFRHMRALTKTQLDVLYAFDEINMATTRLRVRFPGEPVGTLVEKMVTVHPEEVPQRNVQLTVEKFDALKDLSRAKGQLRYLKGLSFSRRQAECQSRIASGNANPFGGSPLETVTGVEGRRSVDEEACPVCQDKLGLQLMVLPCGHLLCCKCCMSIIERSTDVPGSLPKKRITCPTCRQPTLVEEIAFIDERSERNGTAEQMCKLLGGARAVEEASMEVKGSYGTKIEAVVRRLLWVKLNDPDAKVLIFSSWLDVLDVIEHALSANEITFARVKGRRPGPSVQKFRAHTLQSPQKKGQDSDSDEHVQVLLLLFQQGSNGLNLIEAQHVILVEPLSNPAVEAQAINRVHRIGQNRATLVHRFIVSDTVEESIYWLSRKKVELLGNGATRWKSDHDSLTLGDVSALFASKTPSDVMSGEEPCQPASQPSSHQCSSLRRLTPAAAAAAAAEARLRMNMSSSQPSA